MDLSQHSDADLMAAAGLGGGQATSNLSNMSDQQLAEAAGIKPRASTFLGEMGDNFVSGIGAAKDLASGNFQDIGRTRPTPKTEALANKLFPEGSDGSLMGAVRNVGNTVPSDYSGALLEKFGETPEGKALQVMGGVIPSWNALGTAVSRYANPAISNATGIHPDNLQLAEMVVPAAAQVSAKIAGSNPAAAIRTPDLDVAKNFGGKAIDAVKLEPSPEVTSANIRDLSSKAFKQADELGGSANPNVTNAWADRALSLLPQTKEAAALTGESPVSKLVDNIQTLRDQPLSLRGTAEIDSMLGDLANSAVDPKTGKPTAEGRQYYELQHSLRDVWNNATENDVTGGKAGFDKSSQARDLWAAQARMGDIERIMARAEDADNPVTARKNAFRALKNNPNRMRGFTPEENSAINNAADTGVVTNILRVAGSRLAPIGAGVVGAAGGPLGAALGFGTEYAVSGAARALADKLHTSRGNAVLNQIANRPQVQRAINGEPTIIDVKPTIDSAPLALPSPQSAIPDTLVSSTSGQLRAQTYEEAGKAAQRAATETEMGYSPGTRAVQEKNYRNASYDKAEAEFQAKKHEQMVRDWMEQQPDPAQSLDSALNYMVTRAAESGEPIGPIGEAMLRARDQGNLAKKAGNLPISRFSNMTRAQAEAEFMKGKKK